MHDYVAYCVLIQLFIWKPGPIFMWFCICIVFVREGIPCCGEIVSRWDQWSACSSVNAVVHSHFCTSQEMQQLILPHWARASQRCKCGHSSMEPLTSVGKSEIIEQPALSFLLKEREICIGSFMFFIFSYYFFTGKKNTHRAVFCHLACKSKKKMIRNITESDRFSMNFHAGISDKIISGTLKSGDFTVRSNHGGYPQQKMNNSSDSNCNIGIQVCTQSTDPFHIVADSKGSTPVKCEKCIAGKFRVKSNKMTHFFQTALLLCLHVSLCCCLQQLLVASLCTLWIMEVRGSYFLSLPAW